MAGRSSKSKKEYTERQILNSKTPEEYIERTLNCDLPRGKKAALCKIWKEKSGFTTEDIQYARNRHPYWKEKKMSGWQDRNARRWEKHDYRTEVKTKIEPFETERIAQFYDLNKRDRNGKYLNRDWEIAQEMQVTIPAVQHWRRKQLLAVKLIEAYGKKPNKKSILTMLQRHENGLRKELKDINV